MVFIDEILIYSRNKEIHENHLRLMLQRLREKQLYVRFGKYEFWLDRVLLLSHTISAGGIYVDLKKWRQ